MGSRRSRAALVQQRPPARLVASQPLFERADSADLAEADTIVRVRPEPSWRPGILVWVTVVVCSSLVGLGLAILLR